ncbi:MAG: hypothetical protein K5750_10615 [Eubacterium sp.]|nr:hypothetical protein [Eubacterium sp.]
MNCMFCGQPLIPGESQCRSCGRFINAYQQPVQLQGATPAQSTQPQAPQQPQGVAPQQPVYGQQAQRPVQPQQPVYGAAGTQRSVQPVQPVQPQAQQPAQPGYNPQAGAARPAVTPAPQSGAPAYGAAGVQRPVQPVQSQPQQPTQPGYNPQAGAARPAVTPAPQTGAPAYGAAGVQRPVQPVQPQAQRPVQPVQSQAQRPVTPQQPVQQTGAPRPGSPVQPQQAARPAMTFNQQQPGVRTPAPGTPGSPYNSPQMNPQTGAARGAQPPTGGKGKGKMIAIIIAAIVLVAGGILTAVLLTKKDKDKDTVKTGHNDRTTAATTEVTTEISTTEYTTSDDPTTGTTTEYTTETTTTQQASGSKTIMMYIIGTDLESQWGEATMDIQEILDANLSDNVNYIIQTGGAKNWQNDQMIDGECQRFKVQGQSLVELQKLGKMCMADTNTLADFINYCKTEFPADTYMLVLWDHGGGIPISYGYDELYQSSMMTVADMGAAIKSTGVHFESLLFDACLVCTLETAMSVKDSVDYMVAAESYVNGTGYYYTDWLKMYDNCKIGDLDYTEQICRDYMKVIHTYDLVGSISVLEMDKINDVYNAYKNYIDGLNTTVINGNDYVGYTQARNNCLAYESTDTIDIVTLANQYQNDYSTKLINSIVNCVSYTDSDFAPGHGMAVYSPFDYIDYYSDARAMLSQLGYDQAILGFYDSYCSLRAAYQGGTANGDTGEEWYDDETVNDTVDPNYKPQEYTLTTSQNSKGEIIVDVPDDLWNTIETIEMGVILMSSDGNQGLMLGTDYDYFFDDDYNLKVDKPTAWACVNGSYACYVAFEEYDDPNDDSKWYQQGTIFAKINGKDALILVYYSNDIPEGQIQGYAYVDYNNISGATPDYYQFQDTDEIDLVYPVFDGNGNSNYVANEQPFKYADMQLSYENIDLSGYSVIIWYNLIDVYGNTYETEGDIVQ